MLKNRGEAENSRQLIAGLQANYFTTSESMQQLIGNIQPEQSHQLRCALELFLTEKRYILRRRHLKHKFPEEYSFLETQVFDHFDNRVVASLARDLYRVIHTYLQDAGPFTTTEIIEQAEAFLYLIKATLHEIRNQPVIGKALIQGFENPYHLPYLTALTHLGESGTNAHSSRAEDSYHPFPGQEKFLKVARQVNDLLTAGWETDKLTAQETLLRARYSQNVVGWPICRFDSPTAWFEIKTVSADGLTVWVDSLNHDYDKSEWNREKTDKGYVFEIKDVYPIALAQAFFTRRVQDLLKEGVLTR